ncbi:unnamed protein product [Rhizophagus irregularis]|nr:unnamed protein product [Rhizophagus irregularis]
MDNYCSFKFLIGEVESLGLDLSEKVIQSECLEKWVKIYWKEFLKNIKSQAFTSKVHNLRKRQDNSSNLHNDKIIQSTQSKAVQSTLYANDEEFYL